MLLGKRTIPSLYYGVYLQHFMELLTTFNGEEWDKLQHQDASHTVSLALHALSVRA